MTGVQTSAPAAPLSGAAQRKIRNRAGGNKPANRKTKTMKLKIEIKMDGAAFESNSGTEAARLLRSIAADIEDRDCLPGERIQLADINGNSVGEAKVTR